MKKLLVLFVFLLATELTVYAHSDEVKVGEGHLWKYNSLIKRQLKSEYVLNYDTENKQAYFIIEGGGLATFFVSAIKDEQRVKLLSYLDKYQDWNKKAMSEGVTLEKEIGSFNARGMWMVNKDMMNDSDGHDVSASFFSQNKSTHQFVLQFQKYTSSTNQFETEQPDDLYFSYSQAKDFEKLLTDESIQVAIKKAAKGKKITDEFK